MTHPLHSESLKLQQIPLVPSAHISSSLIAVSHFPLLHCKVPVVTNYVLIHFSYLVPGPLPAIYGRC